MKKFLLLSSSFLFIHGISQAEIATPSLDPLNLNINPAASGFYTNSALGGRLYQGDGVVEVDANGTKTEVGETKVSNSLPDFKANIMGEGLNAELFYSQELKYTEDIDYTDAGTDEQNDLEVKIQNYYLNFSYLLSKEVSIGIGHESITSKSTFDTTVSGTSFSSEGSTEQTETKFGVSWRLGDLFHLAAGQSLVKETGENTTSGTTFKNEDLNYSKTFYGVALLSGKPGETLFRLEYNVVTSPETVAEAGDNTSNQTAVHQKNSTTVISAELLMNKFFIGYRSETDKDFEADLDGTDNDESESTKTIERYGLGYITNDGWTLSAYLESANTETPLSDTVDQITADEAIIVQAGIAWK